MVAFSNALVWELATGTHPSPRTLVEDTNTNANTGYEQSITRYETFQDEQRNHSGNGIIEEAGEIVDLATYTTSKWYMSLWTDNAITILRYTKMKQETDTSHPPLLGIAIFCLQKLGNQNNIAQALIFRENTQPRVSPRNTHNQWFQNALNFHQEISTVGTSSTALHW